jgi:putative protease
VGVVEVGKRDMQVVTDVPLSNGDGLNVLVKREVVGFRANIAEPWRVRRRRPEALPLPRRAQRNARRPVQAAAQPPAVAQPRPQLAAGPARPPPNAGSAEWHALREQRLMLTLSSEEGVSVQVALDGPFGVANKPQQALEQLHDLLGQLGTTMYHANASNWTPRRRTSSPTRSSRPCAAKPSRR